jgi:hypothetical protein
MKCISPKNLALYLVGEVTRSQSEEIEEHLSLCGVCRKELESLRDMTGRIGKPAGRGEERDHLPDIRRRIEKGDLAIRRKSRKWPVIASACVLLVALAALVFFLLRSGEPDDEFRVKSDLPPATEQDRWVGIQAFSVGDSGTPAALRDVHKKSDYLVFSYTNLGESPYDFMMIFAVDERGRVYWFHPAYTQAGEDPVSVKISRGAERVELREKVRHEYPEGRLWIYGLFTNEPMKVSSIEKMLKAAEPGERIPLQGSAQHVLALEIKP